MTTTITHELEPRPPEGAAWPTLDREPADTTRDEPEAHSFDPTQGRKIGSDPYDDPTQGRSDPHDDPTRAR